MTSRSGLAPRCRRGSRRRCAAALPAAYAGMPALWRAPAGNRSCRRAARAARIVAGDRRGVEPRSPGRALRDPPPRTARGTPRVLRCQTAWRTAHFHACLQPREESPLLREPPDRVILPGPPTSPAFPCESRESDPARLSDKVRAVAKSEPLYNPRTPAGWPKSRGPTCCATGRPSSLQVLEGKEKGAPGSHGARSTRSSRESGSSSYDEGFPLPPARRSGWTWRSWKAGSTIREGARVAARPARAGESDSDAGARATSPSPVPRKPRRRTSNAQPVSSAQSRDQGAEGDRAAPGEAEEGLKSRHRDARRV